MILLIWEWFKWIAIRLALFLALLTLGPSIGLILFDIMLYVSRTTVNTLKLGYNRRTKDTLTAHSTRDEDAKANK